MEALNTGCVCTQVSAKCFNYLLYLVSVVRKHVLLGLEILFSQSIPLNDKFDKNKKSLAIFSHTLWCQIIPARVLFSTVLYDNIYGMEIEIFSYMPIEY